MSLFQPIAAAEWGDAATLRDQRLAITLDSNLDRRDEAIGAVEHAERGEQGGGADHIGIRVRDLDRALAFYRVLGFILAHRFAADSSLEDAGRPPKETFTW